MPLITFYNYVILIWKEGGKKTLHLITENELRNTAGDTDRLSGLESSLARRTNLHGTSANRQLWSKPWLYFLN